MMMNSNVIKKHSKRGGKRPGSGRKKGIPNRMTGSLKQYAAQYGTEAIDKLVEVMRNPEAPLNSVVAAARELLDRGFGKPVQTVEVSGEIQPIDRAELDRIYERNMVKVAEYARIAEERRELLKKGGLH
jgi:hypothetical protein